MNRIYCLLLLLLFYLEFDECDCELFFFVIGFEHLQIAAFRGIEFCNRIIPGIQTATVLFYFSLKN